MKRHQSLHTQIAKKLSSGFTLIEILIAIAIIGVLASIAIPSYQDYKEKARVTQAITDIASISVKIEAYWQDARAYPTNLADVGIIGMLDPWGNAYRYLDLTKPGATGAARKDRNLVPLNSDFDLYSSGKDGSSVGPLTAAQSKDDVIRANDGKFIDLAAKY